MELWSGKPEPTSETKELREQRIYTANLDEHIAAEVEECMPWFRHMWGGRAIRAMVTTTTWIPMKRAAGRLLG